MACHKFDSVNMKKVFYELLKEWETAEMHLWQCSSTNTENDLKDIADRKNDFIKRFENASNKK